jgi:hypothetical protein
MALSYSEGASLPDKAPEWAISASKRIKEKMEKYGSGVAATPPVGVKKVLLHSCCAPCSGAMVEEMCASEAIEEVVVFFYNPNIQPKREYEIRKVRHSLCGSVENETPKILTISPRMKTKNTVKELMLNLLIVIMMLRIGTQE